MKIITSTHYNRPQCTEQMLKYLSNCIGIENYLVLFFVEPGCNKVLELIESSNLNKEITKNTRLLGLWENKKQALSTGFNRTDYLIHLEDDVLLSPDALKYFEWAEQFRDDKDIASVTTYNRCTKEQYEELKGTPDLIEKRVHYSNTGWAIWKHKFDLVQDWNGQDIELFKKLHKKYQMYELFPLLSRANNIGHQNGVSSPATEMLKLVGNKAFAPIGLSKNSGFLSDKQAYKNALLNQNNKSEVIKHQISKCDKYDFENQLITNENEEEFIKLNESEYKSRDRGDYKNKYLLDFWGKNITEAQYKLSNLTSKRFHSFQLPNRSYDGLVPIKTLEIIWSNLQLECKGKTVLDVGCWDGYFSMRAAETAKLVHSIDINPWGLKDWKYNFQEWIDALNIKNVSYQTISLFDLPDTQYDIVLFMGVLYHLQHPILALEKLRKITKETLILETLIDCEDLDYPALRFYPGAEKCGDPTNWFGPNRLFVESALKTTGFQDVKLLKFENSRAIYSAN